MNHAADLGSAHDEPSGSTEEEPARRGLPAEARVETLLAHVSDVLVLIDEYANVVWASPSVQTYSGFRPEELGGLEGFDFVHPDDVNVAVEGLGTVLQGDDLEEPLLIRLRHRDGSWRWQEFMGSRVTEEDFGLDGALLSVRDVHDRVEAEQALKASEERWRALVHQSSDVVVVLDLEAKLVYATPSTKRIFGRDPEKFVGVVGLDFLHPDDVEVMRAAAGELTRDPSALPRVVVRALHADGSWRWVETVMANHLGTPGIGGVVVTCRDVTERVEAHEALRASEARLSAVLVNSADVPVIVLPDGTIEYVSPAVTSLLGYSVDELIGVDATEFVHPDDLEQLEERLEQSRERGGAFDPVTVRIRTKFGAWLPVEAVGSDVIDPDGTSEEIVVSLRDVRWRQEAEKLLRRSEERFRALVQNSSDAVVVIDGDGKVTYASPAVERVFVQPIEGLVGGAGLDFIHPDDRLEASRALADLMTRPGASVKREFRLLDGEGKPRWVEVTVVNLLEDPAVEGIVGNARDISERKELEARLMHAATHDSLTGLANRALLMDRLNLALARSRRSRGVTAVLFVDLDGFKPINDRLGHRGGDRILVALAHRLQVALRPGDTVARWGGDEFVVVCEDLADRGEVLGIAERVRSAITGTLEVDGTEVSVGACVGVALAAAGSDPDSLIREADTALYRAKEQGQGRVEIADRPTLAEFP